MLEAAGDDLLAAAQCGDVLSSWLEDSSYFSAVVEAFSKTLETASPSSVVGLSEDARPIAAQVGQALPLADGGPIAFVDLTVATGTALRAAVAALPDGQPVVCSALAATPTAKNNVEVDLLVVPECLCS